eukprot:99566_1
MACSSLLVILVAITGVHSKSLPEFIYLYPPFTPFNNDSTLSVNLDAIPALAKLAHNFGANLVWVGGTTGQFDTLTVHERKLILSAWINTTISNKYDFYIVLNVGTTVQSDAIQLAKYAYEVGADAIASTPPYYELCTSNFSSLFNFFKPIVAAANNLPFFYYHIPSMTGYNIQIHELLQAAIDDNGLPQLKGVKFVSKDTMDWYLSTQNYGDKIALMFCKPPQLQWLGLGMGRGAVAMDYWIPELKCLINNFKINNYNLNSNGTYYYESWRQNMSSIISAKEEQRCVYTNYYQIDVGPPRPPQIILTKQQCDDVIQQLNDKSKDGFFQDIENMKQQC